MKKKKIEDFKGTQSTQTGNEDKSNEVQGSQNLGDGTKKHPCFKCDHFKPDFYGARNFNFTGKAGASEINTQKSLVRISRISRMLRRAQGETAHIRGFST